MAIKNVLTFCNQERIQGIHTQLDQQFSSIYRTYAAFAHKQYKVLPELVIKEMQNAQFEFLNFSNLLVEQLRLSTIYDLSNILSADLLPNTNNRTIFIRGLGPALFYQRILHQLLGIKEDIIWGAFNNLNPALQRILPTLVSDYSKRLANKDETLLAFDAAVHRSFDEKIQHLAKRNKFV